MKVKPKVDMERREIAEIAGVTPALVSYYFPNKWDLFRAAAQPMVESYVADTRNILISNCTSADKLKSLVRLFTTFNYENGYVLDFYLERVAEPERHNDLGNVTELHGELTAFFDDLLREGLIRGDCPTLIHSALWALCKYLAQQIQIKQPSTKLQIRHAIQLQADFIFDLFLNGIASPSWYQRFTPNHAPQDRECHTL